MPTLNLFTNVPVDSVVASDILKDATKAVAKIIGKPESYVMILLNGAVPISFAGSEGPAAYGELTSIGGLGPSVNGKLSSTIADILQTKLSIDSSRFYIKFYDVQRVSHWTRTAWCPAWFDEYIARILGSMARRFDINVLKEAGGNC